MHHARKAAWDVLVGVAAAVVAFAAVPGVLAGLVGVPLPARWTVHAVVSLHGLFDLLTIAAWAAWAACAWPLLRSVVTRVRARDATAGAWPAGLRVGDRLALRMAAAVLAVAPVTAGGTVAAGVVSAAAAPPIRPAATWTGAHHPAGPARPVGRAAAARGAQEVTVADGDSLWSIAQAQYDDGGAWPALASANLGRVMVDGSRFVDPNVVQSGWRLTVPSLEPSQGVGERPSVGTRPIETASTSAAPQEEPGGRAGHGSSGGRPPAPGSAAGLLLPELAILGTGTLVAALLARRSRQARRLRSFVREEGAPSRQPNEAAADLGNALGPFEHVPLLEMVELAARTMGLPPGDGVATAPLPPLRLIRAAADGVEVRFASDPPPAPAPWETTDSGSWLLPASLELPALRAAARHRRPWTPVLLPLGEDERGTWLLPVTAGACVSVIGPAARQLAQAMVTGAESWTWHEEVVVTSDPRAAIVASQSADQRPDGSRCPRVLFTGDPSLLDTGTRGACAVLAFGALESADVCILVDETAATVHPLGLTVRPHLLNRSVSSALGELGPFAIKAVGEEDASGFGGEHASGTTNGRQPDPSDPSGPSSDPSSDPSEGSGPPGDALPPAPAFRQRRSGTATVHVRVGSAPPATAPAPEGRPPTAGLVDVRLLTPVPRLDGLCEPLPPKRARRATELVAYLALHAPHTVTGDRLRTRVLGTADADAASKTLFNTVAAARRALGVTADGLPLLPPATRSGHYCVAPAVTVDADRCVALVEAGRAAQEPAERIALLQSALAEVDGEPLSGVLTGYGWWRAEGHERRAADAVVDGASALVRAAVAGGHLDLGRWALEKARVVEPYSETLTRAGMALAAAAGDAHRLRLEWETCLRQVDELDPGGSPSEATERLYARLRHHLRGTAPADEPAAALRV